MNSCLADLSRLIPPQYQRKGRGRIEKTEIIEMSIRYMKQLQNQECMHRENVYKTGYEKCLTLAANFMYQANREICYQLVDYLKEHSNDYLNGKGRASLSAVRKSNELSSLSGDFCKMRANVDSISASSGSPPANLYHHAASVPINHPLRDMLNDLEHSNSNDNNDVKDLSFRNQPQQAPVITSTAPPIVHLDSSSHEFDSSRASSVHAEGSSMATENGDTVMRSVRVRKLSDSHHNDHEHHNYKFKNYIQQRFSQDNIGHSEAHHDEGDDGPLHDEAHPDGNKSPDASGARAKKAKLFTDLAECSSCDEAKPSTNCIGDYKPEPTSTAYKVFSKPTLNGSSRFAHNSVPVFALHSQGLHYVPLNVDYEVLIPYLNGYDLLDKTCGPLTSCHSVNINVNFNRTKMPSAFNGRSKAENVMCNGW